MPIRPSHALKSRNSRHPRLIRLQSVRTAKLH